MTSEHETHQPDAVSSPPLSDTAVPELGAGPQLARRHFQARLFAWFCGFCTWAGVGLLVILLWNIGSDGLGWLWQRTANDPRLLETRALADPQFGDKLNDIKRRTWESDAALEADALADAKQEIADKTAAGEVPESLATLVALNLARLEDKRMGKLHALWMKQRDEFAELNLQPGFTERLALFGVICRDVLMDFASRFPTKSGLKSAIVGSLYLLVFTALFSIPIGVAAAIYLEEYTVKSRLTRFIEVNIANLAGVPSIVYGILGLVIFVRTLGLGRSVIAGAATMSLLILPVIIIAAREAIKAVPRAIREGAFALGGTRWQVVSQHVLPSALPGVLTGVILAMSRAIGETAPMIMIGALAFVAFIPASPLDDFTVLPIQIFNWASRPQVEFHALAAAGIIVLMLGLLLMNSLAIVIRHRAQRNIKW